MEQTEIPKPAGGEYQVDNVVPSHNEIKLMIAAQIASTTERTFPKEISALVANILEDIPQCGIEYARLGGRSEDYNIAKPILFDPLFKEVMDKTVNEHVAIYFDTGDAAHKTCGKLLSTDAIIAPIAAYLQLRPAEPS